MFYQPLQNVLRHLFLREPELHLSQQIQQLPYNYTVLFSLLYSVCLLGNRSLNNEEIKICAKTETVKNNTLTTKLWSAFCDSEYTNATCDEYFTLNNLTEIRAVPGLLSGVIKGEKEVEEGISLPACIILCHLQAKWSTLYTRYLLPHRINPNVPYLPVRQPVERVRWRWYVHREEKPAFSRSPGHAQRQ